MLSFSTLTSAYPSDGIATSFGVTRWNNCSAGFPFCLAGSLGLPSVEYTEYYARSVDLFAERAGPLSLLPASENQKTVIKWNTSEGAVQYLMWVNGDKIINCTRGIFPASQVPTKAHWTTEFLGFLKDGTLDRSDPTCACASAGRACTLVNRTTTFEDSCPGQPVAYGVEPMVWTLAPMAGGAPAAATALVNFTNDILYPPGLPEICYPAGPSGKRQHTNWYHQGHDFGACTAPAPAADDFAVPDDDDCPLASAPPAYAAGGGRPPALRGALPFARAAHAAA